METRKEYALDVITPDKYRYRYKNGFISPRTALASFDNSVFAMFGQTIKAREEQGFKFIIIEQTIVISEREMDPKEYKK